MTAIKERIIGAVQIMSNKDAEVVWRYILSTFSEKEWSSIPVADPDETDLAMLHEIETNPDCQEFVSAEEAMKMLGIQ